MPNKLITPEEASREIMLDGIEPGRYIVWHDKVGHTVYGVPDYSFYRKT